jgi:hypothetical protein
MTKNQIIINIFVAFQLLICAGCGDDDATVRSNRVSIKEIELAGPVAAPGAELSGLAWYDDNLVLLPQYPDRFASTTYGALFYIPKTEILTAIDADTDSPLTPQSIDLHVADLSGSIPGFEGFESIVFVEQVVYMTIEASDTSMRGYIIFGTISADLSGIFLDTSTLQEIPLGGSVPNAADESITYAGGKLLALYEANGANISQTPVAHVFTANLESETPISFLPLNIVSPMQPKRMTKAVTGSSIICIRVMRRIIVHLWTPLAMIAV